MNAIKERLFGAITVMNDDDAEQIWEIIENRFLRRSWTSIQEEAPDDIDLAMINDIKNNPECHEFISQDDAMKEIGL